MAIREPRVLEAAAKAQIPYATKDDVVQASKAVHDHVKGAVEARLDTVQAELGMQVGKVLDGHLAKTLSAELDKRLGGVHGYYEKRLAAAERHFESRLELQRKHYEGQLEAQTKALSLVQERHEQSLAFVQKAQGDAMARIASLIEKLQLPAPTVTVIGPESKPPDVHNHVTLPEMRAGDVIVPELRSPVINVAAVELKDLPAPVVHVAAAEVRVPPPRLVTKTFTYDAQGRPLTVTEKEVEG